jgi:hypothetical protein
MPDAVAYPGIVNPEGNVVLSLGTPELFVLRTALLTGEIPAHVEAPRAKREFGVDVMELRIPDGSA